MIIKDPNDYYRIKGAVALKQIIDDAITAHNAGIKQMFDDAQNEKAVPPSQDGTAPLDDDLARESIDDVGNGGEGQATKKQTFAYGGGFFEVSLKGVFYIDDESKYHFICSPFVG